VAVLQTTLAGKDDALSFVTAELNNIEKVNIRRGRYLRLYDAFVAPEPVPKKKRGDPGGSDRGESSTGSAGF
jgi:hypothetical protein